MKRLIIAFACLLTVFSLTAKADFPDFTSLVKQAAPAVVNISTVQKAPSADAQNGFSFQGPNGEEIPEIFRHFFRFPDQGELPGPQQNTPQSLGSGFIISKDGYILTNHHVVKGADQVLVRLNDRRELEAVVVGSDERSDVALLKIDANDLPVVKIGDSSELEQGEWVIAIGSPFGFDHTVTSGIVSATGRALENETYVPFIQTDVAINPGNSGGPLFNLDGEVVGINSQIYTRSGGFMGLSFAIPIDVAMNVSEQLESSGFVTRGWLGVVIQEVNKDLAESFGLDKPSGALVAKVLPGSPAEAAGFRDGDIITEFNGQSINLSSDLPHQVGRVKPGTKARVDIVRNGDDKVLTVNIGTLPDEARAIKASSQPAQAPQNNRLNIMISDLSQDQKNNLAVSYGILVQKVMAGSAANAGLVAGDVITMLNGKRVDNVQVFEQIVSQLPAKRSVPMRIVRRGSPVFIPLKLNEE
ncbi:DegQ family serine endoprotease [Neptunomonas phycophila]|uniref:Probable periplasmic serine endoprotease DegP-like n=1 Tax=Neptunomonas phycophila TaxID=1572645 RepID=A0AAW7XFI9_9GAMM|nr:MULTISPECIES: DegQ family serine endoprotease [Neptunomonas]MDN2658509.1 DegQ family serine endoprotease [Neptunomonas sp. CHC150]MDO6452920.1 DegQ family serine endoprotease [Neptunomonas phycophila]MDO6467434.1 DegQ family serine endoprotease [Neptunomonas phycophila]MDO6783429.1 DegQ family serine endoprotease [Neptunomonas phycophila]MDP2521448.1 DegQ family serine endoprotease [Neptunomonas phycophila]